MTSNFWVGRFTKIGHHVLNLMPTLGQKRTWVGRSKIGQKIRRHLWMAPSLDNHDVFFTAITIGDTLITDFDLGKVETAGFGARSTRCGHALRKNKSLLDSQ